MDYETASTDAVDSVIPEEYGGMWFFRDPLDCEHLGVTLMELAPARRGRPTTTPRRATRRSTSSSRAS
jgi:hypothetical protein